MSDEGNVGGGGLVDRTSIAVDIEMTIQIVSGLSVLGGLSEQAINGKDNVDQSSSRLILHKPSTHA